jgi:2-octaprenyl-6-methoxyphenol hydroxylase
MGIIPKFENVRVLCPASVNSLAVKEGLSRLSYESEGQERQLSARLVVGADGADSFIRKALGIAVEVHDYEQVAVICNITPEQPHRGRAFECFTPSGPFAVMPHVGGRCGLIWCVAGHEAEDLLLCPEEEFLARANKRFGDHLGRFLKMGERSSYPLRLVTAQEDVRPRVVILGNAAHAIHPVGAQGFNLGLRDVAVLAEVLAEAIDAANDAPSDDASKPNDVDIGDIALLQRYSEWRAPDQEGTIGYSDGLARMFSNPSPVASTARTIGLIAHAVFPSLRRQLAVRAMGYRGRVPRLALGESLHDSSEDG